MFPTGNTPGLINNYSNIPNNTQPSTVMQNQLQIPTPYPNATQPQTLHNQVPMLQQYQQLPVQMPATCIPTTNNNHPTTSSQHTAKRNIEHVYHTTHSDDESILSDETAEVSENMHPWQAVTRKRKRTSQLKPTENHPITKTNNRYELLQETALDETSTENITSKSNSSSKPQPNPRPPPIYIYGVRDYKAMMRDLAQAIEDERYHTKTLANNTVKINTHSIEGYRQLIRHLRDKNIIHHTYQIKQERAYRIVLRDLHHSIPTEDIKDELLKNGHTVRNIVNIRHRVSKEPLPMFFVDLEPNINNKDIYKLEFLQNTKIRVEAPRIKNSIIQCTRCQDYGHSKTYCRKPFNCVKCGGPHDSLVCTKPKDTPATCALCSESHPANYKGCTVYQDLKARNFPKQTNVRTTIKPNISNSARVPQIIATNIQGSSNNFTTYAQATANNTTNSNATTDQFSNFLNEFKNMFSQLLNQNSMILTMLTTLINKLTQ